MPAPTGMLTLSSGIVLGTLLVCTGPSTGNTESVYWAIYWIDWLCLGGPLLDILIFSTGTSTGSTDFVYWPLYWTYDCVHWGGPGISLRFSHDVLLLVPVGLGLHHDTSVVYRMCVYKKYVACPSDDNPFLLMMTTSSYFCTSLCFFASFF